MKKYNLIWLIASFLILIVVSSIGVLTFSAADWLSKPNNFIFTKESYGAWSPQKSSNDRASGFNLKLNAACAKPTYDNIEKRVNSKLRSAPEEKESFDNDIKRFFRNKNLDIEFETSEISNIGHFKWLKNNYVTYDDPTLKSGIRFSFANKCLYDKECSLTDSLDYLFIKIGIKYFLNSEQLNYLNEHCIEKQKVFFKIRNNYNFGRSNSYYRNGLGIWLSLWYNLAALSALALSALILLYFLFRKKS